VNQRAQRLAELLAPPLDLLIVGGGIVGAGIARDAAMRGLRAGLAEQHDFAFGTSSRSSRLLHGGVRYLAQGRLGLVRQASVEKKILHHIAPHLSAPLAFVFPTYRHSDWPLWQLRVGVKIYDVLCRGKNFGKSSSFNRAAMLQWSPRLSPDQLTGAVRYFDALTNDARLVLDTVRSAANHGATVMNYFKFLDARREGSSWICELEDVLTGQSHVVHARAVVNATGPWADGLPHSRVHLRLTKGIHLVIERSRLPVSDAVVMPAQGRILFAIPWGERVILGTTDTDYKGAIEAARPEREDIAYLLQIANNLFPEARLLPNDIISIWAGVRPLIANGESGAPSDISRSHHIRTPEPGWWDVAGGKLTTYRLMAEETVDEIVRWLKELNTLNGKPRSCTTAEEALLPASETEGVSGILPPAFNRRVVEHFCAEEWAVHLDDIMVRRSGWHYYLRDAREKAQQAAEWMAELRNWSAERRAAEVDRYERVTHKPESNPSSFALPHGR
jgi:glycerol-3-phosphate dehydrogenase